MDFAFATEPAPGRPNEDHLVVSAGFAILLDGVTELPGSDTGCRHGPGWLVRMLGAHLAAALSADRTTGLDQVLAGAIEAVGRLHAHTCDLTNPNSPSSTVAIVRERGQRLDYLVLCDSSVVFEDARGIVVVSDDRTGGLPGYDRDTVARLRNRPGGFWVASTEPAAAAEAITGSVDRNGLFRLLLCTDGVSRLVDIFGLGWAEVFRLAEAGGPRAVIEAVRAREVEHPGQLASSGRTVKRHDDATLAVLLR
ncbi:protein phosphatase 2C domain-containing protein [Plantactinospora sp. S1510]|uniref:Protein phosphatase 2C domain-containing protein n=1 Tax=Plantactinospora alkalitolerans TaxID=2789879 RepID=A0ABS0H5S1_9ACTN|nr:protein phosphatase 2C domain-containing protein [Plantactinospora alkalitolerans]MBF9133679.1 protein phosphatase 2C domain-containing protein [Plantactinospora alkalitolerans]